MSQFPHVVFAGGGTTGHLYPGLAVAGHLCSRLADAQITFLGTGRPLERHEVRDAGYNYAAVPSQPAPNNPLRAVRFVTDNVAGYWASRWFLKEQHVSLVVGLGGYASAATVRAAMSRGIPTLLLEQNVVAGRVTQWLASAATRVCLGFEQTRAKLPTHAPLLATGNPVRPAFEYMYGQRETGSIERGARQTSSCSPLSAPRSLLVIGGAGGARSLNEFMPHAARRMRQPLDGWQIIHRTGEGQLQETERRYRQAGVEALVVSYIDELASVMFDADLVVCRASGTTLAEFALAGAPAVLVPHPLAIDDHQLANAEVFEAEGAANVIDETSLAGSLDDALVEQLAPLLTDDWRRQTMAAKMRAFARPDAAAHVADAIYDVLCGASLRLAA